MTVSNTHNPPVTAGAFSGQEHLISADLDGKVLHWHIDTEGELDYAGTLRLAGSPNHGSRYRSGATGGLWSGRNDCVEIAAETATPGHR